MNGEPYHKPSYNQSMSFPDIYVSSYSHAVLSYQLIIDLWSLYFLSCIFFVQLIGYHSHEENCKYFQLSYVWSWAFPIRDLFDLFFYHLSYVDIIQHNVLSTSTLKGGIILVCNYQQHFLY